MLYLGKHVPAYALSGHSETPACRQFQFGLILSLSCWFGLARDTPVVQWLAQILTATQLPYQGDVRDTHRVDMWKKIGKFKLFQILTN